MGQFENHLGFGELFDSTTKAKLRFRIGIEERPLKKGEVRAVISEPPKPQLPKVLPKTGPNTLDTEEVISFLGPKKR